MAPQRRAGRLRGKSTRSTRCRRACRVARAEPHSTTAQRAGPSRAQVVSRAPRRSRRRAPPSAAAAALASSPLRPVLRRSAAPSPPADASRSRRPLARTARAGRPGRVARELVSRSLSLTRTTLELDRELEQRPRTSRRRCSTSPAAERSSLPSCSPTPGRRRSKASAARQPHWRRTHPSQLQARATPPTQPRRQPTTQRRLLPIATPTPATTRRTLLHRTQTSRRQKPPRSHPLPQTPTRTPPLQHTESEPRLDIGASLAHPSTAVCRGAE